MHIRAELQKDDVDYLFSLSYGELLNMLLATADRLMAEHLIEAAGMLDGARVTGRSALQRGHYSKRSPYGDGCSPGGPTAGSLRLLRSCQGQ